MKICLINHNFEYAIRHIAYLFFPNEKIQFVDRKYIKQENEPYIESVLRDDGVAISVLTTIMYTQHANACISQRHKTVDRDNKCGYDRLCRDIVKLSFFEAATKVKHVNIPWGILTGIRPTKIVHKLFEEGKEYRDIKKVFEERYAVNERKADLAIEVAQHEKRILTQLKRRSIGIYISIPFCPTRCLYCSFVSNAVHKMKDFIEPYIDALEQEIMHTKNIIQDMGWQVESVYIGGGTPTVLSPYLLDKLLNTLCNNIDMREVKEFTVEAGRPDTIDEEKLRILYNYRVNRLSINPQTMHDTTLKVIGRNHSKDEIIHSFALARNVGFKNINMDVIAGLPGETEDMFKHTIKEIERLSPENITVHTMSVKRASRLHEKIGEYTLVHSDIVNNMLMFSQQFLKDKNMFPYYMYRQKNILGNLENVGYCKPNFECIYNIKIMEEKNSIIALGSGAVTKIVDLDDSRIERIFNLKDVREYINRIEEMMLNKNKIYNFLYARYKEMK